jgi:phosphoribosylformylglycinamidine synthase
MSDGPFGQTGNIIAIGEQPIKGLVNNEAGINMSVAESFTNAVWAPMENLSLLNLSATWQWPFGQPGESARLYEAVRAASRCVMRIASRIGVGKDSLSMTLKEIESDGTAHPILSPGTVQMTAFGPCDNINNVITPDIKMPGKSKLMFIDLAKGQQRLGGSALLRVYEQIGNESPDLEDPDFFIRALMAIQKLIHRGLILSGHDRSDGGLISCVLEMAFAGDCGVQLDLRSRYLGGDDWAKLLFNEELGLVIEFLPENYEIIRGVFRHFGVAECCHIIGKTYDFDAVDVFYNGNLILVERMSALRAVWRETSFQLDSLQSNPELVAEEREITREQDCYPKYRLSFIPRPTPKNVLARKKKPKAAVLLEAGANGDRDLAEAAYLAGFDPWDVHVNDLNEGKATLRDFQSLLLPGGFVFKDTFDAGKGLA